MNKIYDLVHLNGYVYGVDKEVLNDICPQNGTQVHKKGDDSHGMCDCTAIVFSNDPSLGLPLLPPIEEAIPYLQTTDEDQQWAYREGYKAAKAKRYTEEDIKEVIDMARSFIALDFSKPQYSTEEIIKSLNPLPKQVEVEMEMIGNPHEWIYAPKVNENNIVNVIRWIYE
jgi:hypothetical protein